MEYDEKPMTLIVNGRRVARIELLAPTACQRIMDREKISDALANEYDNDEDFPEIE